MAQQRFAASPAPPVAVLESNECPQGQAWRQWWEGVEGNCTTTDSKSSSTVFLQCTRCAPTIFNAISRYGDKLEKSHHQVVPMIETVGTPSPV